MRVVSVEDGVVSLYDKAGVLRRWPTTRIVRLAFTPQHPKRSVQLDEPNSTDALQNRWLEAERLGQSELAQRLRAMFEAMQRATAEASEGHDASAWVLTLTDGQQVYGKPANGPGGADADTLHWTHPLLGTIAVSLERVQRIEHEAPEATATAVPHSKAWAADNDAPRGDTITLRNGDTLTGFVAAIDRAGVTLETDTGDVPIDWEALAGLSLSNPKQLGISNSDSLALRDGTQLDVRSVQFDGDTLAVTPVLLAETLGLPAESQTDEQAIRTLPIAEADHLDFAASGRRLIELTRLAPQVTGGEAFGLAFKPRLIPFHGTRGVQAWVHPPTTLRFALPANAERIAGTVTLSLPRQLNPQAATLAGANFAIRDTQGEPFARSLRLDRPLPFRVPIAGDTLELVLASDPDGATLGRARFENLQVLLRLDIAEPR